MNNRPEFNVAIVGGGVAGCYAAYRLVAEGPKPLEGRSVGLFEASARLGGRLWSHRSTLSGTRNAELGGMRFTAHSGVLYRLLEELDLQTAIQGFDFDRPENLCYLRGKRFRRAQLTTRSLSRTPGTLPYEVLPQEEGRSAGDLLWGAITAVLPRLRSLQEKYRRAVDLDDRDLISGCRVEYEDMKEATRLDGLSLFDLTFGEMLRHTLSSEAMSFVEDVGGYELTYSTGSAAAWLDNEFFAIEEDPPLELADGFETVPKACHDRFEAAGGSTFLEHQLIHLEPADAGGYRMIFSRSHGHEVCVRANSVLLALPEVALRRLGNRSPSLLSPRLSSCLASVRPVPALKLFLEYREPWWQRTGVSRGRSTTTLPIRQCYYFKGGDRHLLMAAYVNGPDVDYWRSYVKSVPGTGQTPRVASPEMIREAHDQLKEVHGIAQAEEPVDGFFQDWSDPPHGTAWYVWSPGARPRQTVVDILRPNPTERCFIAGSCWSLEPGSVHGALRSVDTLFEEHGKTMTRRPS